METYIAHFMAGELPVPLLLIAVLWCVVFSCSAFLVARAKKMGEKQSHITVPQSAQASLSVPRIALQVFVTSAVFLFANSYGGAGEAFFAGGWFITAGVVLAMNLRNFLSIRRLAKHGAASGQLAISAEYSLLERSYELAASALLFFGVAVLLAQPAALGAAWLLGANSVGYRKKARAAAGA